MLLYNFITQHGYTVTVLVSPDHPDARKPVPRIIPRHGEVIRWRTLNGHKLQRAHKDRPRTQEIWG